MANYPIYRLVKGSTLTFTEMDGNLEWLSRTMSASVVTITGSTFVLGNLNVSDGITGSLFGTSSWAVSASWAPSNTSTISSFIATGSVTASVGLGSTIFSVVSSSNTVFSVTPSGSLFLSSSITASNALVTGTLTVQTIVAQTITSSTDFITGSTRFGSLLSNTHQFTGSVSVTGSLLVNNSSLITGTGSTGQVAYWNGTNSQTGSNNLFWDAANNQLRLQSIVDISAINEFSLDFIRFNARTASNGVASLFIPKGTPTGFAYNFEFRKSDTGFAGLLIIGGNASAASGVVNKHAISVDNSNSRSDRLVFRCAAANTSWSIANDLLTLLPTGNVVIQNTSQNANDSGQRLQVYGDTFLSGSVTGSDTIIRGSTNTSATTALIVQNSVGENILRIRNDGFHLFGNSSNRPLFATVAGISSPSVNGTALQFVIDNSNARTTTGFDLLYTFGTRDYTSGNVDVHRETATFSPTSGTGTFNMLHIINTINQTGGANGITRALYINPTITSASDFRAIETSAGNVIFGTSSAGFYWDNTNSRLGIGTNTPAYTLDTNGTFRVSGLGFSTGYSLSVQRLQFNNGTAGTNLGYIVGTSNGVIRLVNAAETDFTRLQFGGTTTAFPALQRSGSALCVVDANGGSLSNLLIGGTVDSTQRLQVYGDAFIKGSGATSATFGLTVQNSANTNLLTVRNDGNVGIGTNAPGNILEIAKNQNASTTLIISNTANDTLADTRLRFKPNAGSLEMGKYSIAATAYKIFLGSDSFFYNGFNGDISILNDHAAGKLKFAMGASSTAQMTLTAAGRLLLGTTSEGTFTFDVNGTARVSGYTLFGSGNSGTPLATLTDFRGSSDTDFIQVARVSTSSDRYVRIYANGQIDALSTKTDSAPYTFAAAANANTSGNRGLFSITNTFNPTSGTATYTAFQINQTVSQSGGANGITRGLYVNPILTAAANWRSMEWSNNSGFGLYGDGTANNYLGGKLGIGVTSPSYSLQVNSNSDDLYIAAAGNAPSLNLLNSNSPTLVGTVGLSTSPNNFIQNSVPGDLCISTRGSSNSAAYIMFGSGSTMIAYISGSGDMYVAGTLTQGSTRNIKQNIVPITSALSKVMQIQGVTYDKKDGSAINEPGFIAEDMYPILPSLVSLNKDGEPQGIKYTNLTAYLLEAIKEQQQQINNLQQQINTLTNGH